MELIETLSKNNIPFIIVRSITSLRETTSLSYFSYSLYRLKSDEEIKRLRNKTKQSILSEKKLNEKEIRYFKENIHLYNRISYPDGDIFELKKQKSFKQIVNKTYKKILDENRLKKHSYENIKKTC